MSATPAACPAREAADGQHSWGFDGDDPYIICHWCDEMQDALTGRVIQPGRSKR